MKRSTFDAIVSFLQGVIWALIILGAWITFQIVSLFDTGIALFSTVFFIFAGLFAVLLLETLRTYRHKAEEVSRQTARLEEIRDALKPGSAV